MRIQEHVFILQLDQGGKGSLGSSELLNIFAYIHLTPSHIFVLIFKAMRRTTAIFVLCLSECGDERIWRVLIYVFWGTGWNVGSCDYLEYQLGKYLSNEHQATYFR